MASFRDLYGSGYLNAADVPDRSPPAKILDVVRVEFERGGGELKPKLAMTLEGWAKPLALNVTNCEIIAETLGDDYEQWPGATLQLVKALVKFQGKPVNGIRVTNVKPAGLENGGTQ